MTVIVDTTAVPPGHRNTTWARARADGRLPMEAHFVSSRPFRGRIVGYSLGSVDVVHVRAADPMTVTGLGPAGPPAVMHLGALLCGTWDLHYGDRAS